MAKIGKKDKRRVLIGLLLIVIIASYLGVFSFNYWTQIFANKREKARLEEEYTRLLEKEETLKSQVTKLQDPDYMLEYAREKYMLSKDDEIIIKVDDIEKDS